MLRSQGRCRVSNDPQVYAARLLVFGIGTRRSMIIVVLALSEEGALRCLAGSAAGKWQVCV